MRGGGVFSDEEIQLLRELPAVANVTRNRITYSDAFKQVCTIRYLAGESPTKIFREAGLPPELVGYKRIERSVARWKAAAIKSVSGNDHLDDSEIIAQLVERYKRTLVTRRNRQYGVRCSGFERSRYVRRRCRCARFDQCARR